MNRQDYLNEASQLIHGDRQDHYGTPQENFRNIADRWSQFLGIDIAPWQVCVMMADLKIARMRNGFHDDSVTDAIGYMALAGELKP